jgi:hypothetical protein
MSVLSVAAAAALVGYIIWQQLVGTPMRGKRVVMMPLIVTLIGIVDFSSNKLNPSTTDIVLIVLGAAISVAIGVALGAMTRLERRDGHLWAQLPKAGLLLWAGLLVSRVAIVAIAHATGAQVAAGTAAVILVLGLNRVAQALVIVPRAVAAGIPFAPEKDGRVFGAVLFSDSRDREG